MIKRRHTGFHAPLTLVSDTLSYCDSIETLCNQRKSGSQEFAVPGNGPGDIRLLRETAQKLQPRAQAVATLESQLSEAYAEYDREAVDLWNGFAEARDHAQAFAERREFADLSSIVNDYVYHTGRPTRHNTSGSNNSGNTPTK
jgi:hypothetical protein